MKEYNLKQDHTNIKKQIKEWEIELDKISDMTYKEYDIEDVRIRIDELSNAMMAINI